MFDAHYVVPLRRVFVKPDKEDKEKKPEQEKIASPVIDGRKFIGSGEDAHLYNESR